MQVELVSVERPLWSGEATAVYARTTEGEIGIMAGHAPLLGAPRAGLAGTDPAEPTATSCGSPCTAASCRSAPDGVSVLAEMAETADEIDVARARQALERIGDATDDESVAARDRALARLRAAGEQV